MDRFQEMLADLRSTFTKKIPGGLTDAADTRLQKTLTHYAGATRGSPLEILSLTYDSMAKWYRKNLTVETFESEVDADTLFQTVGRSKESKDADKGPKAAPFDFPELQKVAELPRVIPTPYVQQKDVLQPQENVVKYREAEVNLVMNSKDRDWLKGTTQNRYNFTIQFNTNYKSQPGIQANIQTRLRNIIRIEFVKAILPVEGLVAGPATPFYSVLAMPSINVLVDEFLGNNFGTNNAVDKSLAICQYDSTWRSDHFSNSTMNRGYALFIPKFMKAQRVYTPTPLSNLQTLSFRIQDSQDELLSTIPDAFPIASFVFGSSLIGSTYATDAYIFIRTKEWFSQWSFSQLDKILMQGNGFISGTQPEGGAALVAWLQATGGHTIVGCAHDLSGSDVSDGSNAAGYANWLIIQNRVLDPQLGSTTPDYFTGSSTDEAQLAADLIHYPQEGAILNLSRQVQLTVRIITREYDTGTNIRPDNV